MHRKRRHHHSKFAGSGSPAVEVGAHLVAKRESSRKEESSLEQPRRLLRRPRQRNFLLLPLLRVPPANLKEKIQQLCHVLHTTQPPSRLWRPSQPAKLRLLPTNTRQVFFIPWPPCLSVCLTCLSKTATSGTNVK